MIRASTIVTATAIALSACSHSEPQPIGPASPSGATEIPGRPTETTSVATTKIPTSQQEAQDAIVRYLQETINALPKGTSLDGSRYVVGDGTNYCEDNPADSNSPVMVVDIRDMTLPPGTDTASVIAQTGDTWRDWGWKVLERDGFSKPNQFGYAPDGYVLQIESRPNPTQPPSLTGTSPCFTGDLRSDHVKKEIVLKQQTAP